MYIPALIAIILSALVITVISIRFSRWAESIIKKNDTLLREINAHSANNSDTHPTYRTLRITHSGHYAVARSTTHDGIRFLTYIKLFSDPDPDFNRLQAEELCEILNEK